VLTLEDELEPLEVLQAELLHHGRTKTDARRLPCDDWDFSLFALILFFPFFSGRAPSASKGVTEYSHCYWHLCTLFVGYLCVGKKGEKTL
jgi:hypothetical protein